MERLHFTRSSYLSNLNDPSIAGVDNGIGGCPYQVHDRLIMIRSKAANSLHLWGIVNNDWLKTIQKRLYTLKGQLWKIKLKMTYSVSGTSCEKIGCPFPIPPKTGDTAFATDTTIIQHLHRIEILDIDPSLFQSYYQFISDRLRNN